MSQDATQPAFVPGYEFVVFFSYGHLDNAPDEWVTKFYVRLKAEVETILGEPVSFFIDPKLKAGDLLDATIKQRIARSAAFLPILGPRYVRSPNCLQELQWFFDAAQQSGGLHVGTGTRLMPVEKYPPGSWPPAIADLNPITPRFYKIDDASGNPETYSANPNFPAFLSFDKACRDLAADLAKLLQTLRKERAAEPKSAPRSIFLGATTFDLKGERERIANYLRGSGYAVLGEGPVPATKDELLAWTAKQLEAATLAIHLIGSRDGLVPEGEQEKPVVWLQCEQIRASKMRQLIWISPAQPQPSEKQTRFLAFLS